MPSPEGIEKENDQDCLAEGLLEGAGALVDIAFDDWGLPFLLIGCVVVVVFVAVSALGCLLTGEGFKNLGLK
jgi:hypothetical protein